MSPIDLLDDTNRSSDTEQTKKLNGSETDSKNCLEENDEINSVNQDTTPTPTPNESNTKSEEKFGEFSLPKNLPPPHPPPLPTSLPLKSNLNSTCNKPNIHHSYTSQPIYNTSPMSSYQTLMYQSLPNTPQLPSPMYPPFMNYVNKADVIKGSNSPSTVFVHVDAGHIFQVQLGDKVRDILGPATVKIVNNDSTQPVPLQLTAPAPGQIVQQIVDENGILVHLIISSQQPPQQQQQQQQQFMHTNGSNHRSDIPNGLNQQQAYKQTYFNQGGYYPNQTGYYQNQFQNGQFLQPISIESNQEFKENSLSDLDSETSLLSQSKSDGDINESNTNSSNTPGLSSTLSISPLSSSSCSSASASNSTSSSSSSNCSTSSCTYKTDDQTDSFKRKLNNNNQQQQQRLNTSNQAINTSNNNCVRTLKENKIFVNSTKKQSINGTLNQTFNNQGNKLNQLNSTNQPSLHHQYNDKLTRQPIQVKKILNGDSKMEQKSTLLIENHRLNQEPIDIDLHIENNLDFFETILQRIKKPSVKNIEPQSVFAYLNPIELVKDDLLITDSLSRPLLLPDIIAKFQNLNYTLEISCENETNFVKVYTGDANEITLKDLKANTKYFLRVCASLNSKCKSPMTEVVSFQTKPLQPDQPQAPKQTGIKKKNELTLKWISPCDNGSKITNFVLEYQEVCSGYENMDDLQTNLGEFTQIYQGPLKQFMVKKLNPNTCYGFRVAAENSHGLSEFSPVSFVYTSGSVPSVPEPPRLVESTVDSLTLTWGPKRLNDVDYELQMFDSEHKVAAAHGFLTIYNGPSLVYTVTDLRRQCVYQFRLRAKNEEGNSAWSEVKKFTTQADVPKQPGKVRTKIQGLNQYKFNWESPKDDGGDKITTYTLEMSEYEQNVFEEIYTGDKNECCIEKFLKPGFCYVLRVSCSNSIGQSPYSEISSFITASVPPGRCYPPKLNGKPKSNSVQVKWTPPEDDGGALINNYELSLLMDLNDEENVVYKGNELFTTVNGLLPGRNYLLKVRALNKNGPSEWSDCFEFSSGAACPDTPDSLFITTKSSNCILINWTEPVSNGSPIIEYRLEWSLKDQEQFTNLYTGNSLKFELKSLFLPYTKYMFRVQAININGPSQFSKSVEYLTPASVPSIVTGIRIEEINSDSTTISWKQPNNNGAPIQFYNIDFSDVSTNSNPYIVLHQNECKYMFDTLQPDTNYKFRIQAANSVGIGQFSNILKFKTKALAPLPPNLECVSISYNSVKLKWNGSDNLVFILQTKKDVQDETLDEFITVYKGPLTVFKVNRLLESTNYLFRVCAVNEAGQGKWSDTYKYTTAKSPPLITRPPLVTDISQTTCQIEWQTAKIPHSTSDLNDEIRSEVVEYSLQIQKKDTDYKEVYRGIECAYKLKELEANTEYSLRVCAAILKDEATQKRICSPFSPVCNFTTLKQIKNVKEKRNSVDSVETVENGKNWFDHFLMPSFFQCLNPKLRNESTKNQSKSKQPNSKLKSSQTSKATTTTTYETSSLDYDSKIMNRRKSDQYWAFLLIFVLVLLAFLIAYCVSYYFELASVNSTEF